MNLNFGITVPNFGDYCGSARNLGELADEAEKAKWDGFFVFDHILYSGGERVPLVDPWIALTVIAMNTERMKIGPLVTPIARRRPWKLARETTSIDHLSNGRLVLGVGLGDPPDVDFESFAEDPEDRIRGEKLDEGLQVLTGLWRGEPFNYNGKYYKLRNVIFAPPPLQSPRIPVWIAGRWPKKKPFVRASQWDGVFPLGLARGSSLSPDEIKAVASFIKNRRGNSHPFDIVVSSGATGQVDDNKTLEAYADAGATWWLQDMRKWCNSSEELKKTNSQRTA